MTLAVLIAAAIVATIEAQKNGGQGGDLPQGGGEAEASNGEPGGTRAGASEVTNLCFTGISVSTNGVALSLAWPTNYLFAGDIVDLFAATSLVGAAWNWVAAHGVASNTETNWTEIVDTAAVAGTPNPPMMFFSASLRADPGDLRDTDGDTMPDAYEIRNGTNPYVPDYALAPRLTVGPSGMHADISSALAASEAYDIVELDPTAVHDVGGLGASVPAHPVMVCSPPGQRAVVKATGMSAFLLDAASSSRTLFRNLYILLDARSGFQVGFWVGGNLPWYPVVASVTCKDIYVRAPNPGVEYFGWLLYNSAADAVTLSRCTVNAAGSEWVYGVQDFGSSPLVLDCCSFINFPPNLDSRHTSCGILSRSSLSAGGGVEVSVSRCLFDESFTNAVMFGRLENGESNVLSVVDCMVPRELPSLYHPDSVSGLVVANAALTWSGFPWPDSPSVALGMGALMPFANDPTADTDGDGFCDYAEVYEKGTDPYLADSDLDGMSDYDEDQQGTDPTNPHSFKQNLTVTVTNTVSLSHAAYLAWGYYETGWEANEVVMFQTGVGSNLYVNASSNGAEYVKAFCDLDGDGVFSAATDILIATKIPLGAVAAIDFVFGDVDGDGVTDEQEREDGTDPYDEKNYAVNLFGCFEGVFHTTNSLSVQILMNTNVMYGPIVLDATNRVWTFGPQSLVAVTGGHPKFVFWDDANFNGVCEAFETAVTYAPSPFAHDMAFTNRLSYGAFDKDNDGMLDWWELQYGLSPANAIDAFLDDDGDGMLNIQEYDLGLNPLVSAGTNNLFYVLNRSLDDRIEGLSPTNTRALYYNIMTNGHSTNFIPNVQSWLSGVDLSCCAIWSEYAPGTTGPYGNTAARITLVGPRHVVYARHFDYRDELYGETMPTNKVYFFRGKSGTVYGRRVIKKNNSIGGDIGIGVLNETLPTNDVTPAIYFPMDFESYLGKGHLLPYFFVDENIDTYVVTWDGITSANRTEPVYGRQKNIANRSAFWKQGGVRSGSSSPQFMLAGNQPVLIGTLWRQYGGNPGSAFATLFKIEIEAKFRILDNTSDFQLKTLDLSGFQTIQEME